MDRHRPSAAGVVVNALLDQIAKEKDPTYVAGKTAFERHLSRSALEAGLPKLVTVTLPQVTRDGDTVGPIDVKMRAHVKAN
jgi:hypothetical protein